ncbi:MAG: CRISPR-associated helicase Cas3' [Proteobacteria bacterium]|nr:CRISPR-associated helicase Cas3' [Pseudomonadota bacterium]
MNIDFKSLFTKAMGPEIAPYPYQISLAANDWPDIVKIETGMGKTAGIILAWLYKRLQGDPRTPRRLVYCLPMRVLVEQTASCAGRWIERLVDSKIIPPEKQPSVYVLMGGDIDNDWDRYPENEAILIGTQDQLLSRALNRGFATSRFRWPIQFGLLNNDCMWVMDEVQLMGSGLATTAQMAAFRGKMGTLFPTHSLWMSATLQKDWLNTVDFSSTKKHLAEITLTDEDKQNPSVRKRFEASKSLKKVDVSGEKPAEIAELILDAHQKGTRTLAVFNTVRRATEIYSALMQKKPDAGVSLIHSRFRPGDRQRALEKILASPGKKGSICISTQVIEAGVDISSATLLTELAPWSSLVQRFGRCNRYGLDSQAKVIWIDIDEEGALLPYNKEEIDQARSELIKLKDVGPQRLPAVLTKVDYVHVLRQKDLVDIFDTSPDLEGFDIDISRFIRESADYEVQVFWRDLPTEGPSEEESAPSREELCSAPLSDLRKAEQWERWHWDHLEKRWALPRSLSPGMVLMLRASAGGYSPELGWTGDPHHIPLVIIAERESEEAVDDDRFSATTWQKLGEHNDDVVKEMETILSRCPLPDRKWQDLLHVAARWHDAGKAHKVFQEAVLGNPPEADPSVVWGKTGKKSIAYQRRGFRHELASALAALKNHIPDLIAYLIAAHHGKVRLSIRSLPIEAIPDDPAVRFARGIWDEDVLPDADLGGGHHLPETVLNLSCMDFGEGPTGPSWLARMIALRDDPSLGPFRLAYLEAILRAADWRASQRAGGNHA